MESERSLLEIFDDVIALAVRAPSMHNTQPWRWRLDDETIRLYADPARHLPATDPDQQSLLLSCGAALQHLRVALAMYGRRARVEYLPDPADPRCLARITVTGGSPTSAEIDAAAAILYRQSDRRRYGSRPVAAGLLREVATSAVPFGAAARIVPPPLRGALVRATRAAAERHAHDTAYLDELLAWSGRHGTADGVPAANTPPACGRDGIVLRTFAEPELRDCDSDPDAAEWLVICTPDDSRAAWLRAGEAAGAVLLTATAGRLVSCLQTEPLGIPDLRDRIRAELLLDAAYPQLLVRIGWPVRGSAPLPFTPRRPPAEVTDAPIGV